ncbi:MAG: hypothetical protein ABJF04_15200 [Reichenbachiella sp.]|uniref:hypothetical protein n=1 Tax=Reichenbachiella sp. TaxID=2184521 RepID=UPI00326455D7
MRLGDISQQVSDKRLLPFVWPWANPSGQGLSVKEVLLSRKFSFAYLLISWMLVMLLGFASNRDCHSTWQLNLLCDQAIWLIKIKTDPIGFIQSLITSAWIHNGIEHLLFVSIIGIVIIIQSFESQYGSRFTVFVFFITHILIGITFAILFNIGISWWPDNEYFQYGFERNWMGGSVGFYAIIGAFSFLRCRGWFLVSILLSFEVINHLVLGTSIHISMIHTLCLVYGNLVSRFYTRVLIPKFAR